MRLARARRGAQGRQPARRRARARARADRDHAPGRGRRSARELGAAPETSRAACAFLRAAVFRWIAPRAAARSIQRTSSRCSSATRRVALGDRGLEPARERLDRRAVAQVLQPLRGRDPDALLLLLDVRHGVKMPAPAGGAMVAAGRGTVSRIASQTRARSDYARSGRRPSYRGARPKGHGHGACRRPRSILAAWTSSRPRRRLAWSTAIFSLATGLSRILGLVREIVARYYFGTVGAINAFEVAFLIPNTVRALVADAALSSAFVPVFSELLEKGERKRAWRVASSLFWLVLLGLGGAHRAVHRDRAVDHGRVRLPAATRGGRPLARPLPDRRAARPLRDRRRDPQQLRALHRARAHAGRLEHRDHRRASCIGVPRADGIDAKLYVYAFSILIGDGDPVPAAAPVAARPRRPAAGRDRLARPGRQADVFVLMVPVTLGLGLINFNASSTRSSPRG